MSRLFICFLFFACFMIESQGSYAQLLSSEMGTIIVTYQTDHEGQRLDRIRFWLINENHERTLYPKKDEFVANNHSRVDRTVVITHLPVGKYRIEFLVPNADHYFEEVPPRQFDLTSGDVIKVDQSIKKNVQSDLTPSDFQSPENENAIADNAELLPVIIVNYPPPNLPLPTGPIPIRPAKLNINVNLNTPWRLMHDGQLIYSGKGPMSNFPIPPGHHYYLLAQDLPGYSLHIIPPNPFDAAPGESIKIELLYQHDIGYIEIKGQIPSLEKHLAIKILNEQQQQPPLDVKVKPINGQISWQSGALATGEYLVIFELPGNSLPPEKQRFFVEKGRKTILIYPSAPSEMTETTKGENGSLEVTADISQAIFNLYDQSGISVGQGQGFNYSFSNLAEGKYELKFSSADPRIFIPPASQEVLISSAKKTHVQVSYKKMGSLTIGSNVDSYSVIIQPEDQPNETMTEKIAGRSKTLYLPEGRYTIVYEPLAPGSVAPKSAVTMVRSTSPQTVYQAYEVETKHLKPVPKSEEIGPNSPEPDLEEEEEEALG